MDLRKILTPRGCSVSAGDGLAVQSGNRKLLTLSLGEIRGHKGSRCSPCIMVVWLPAYWLSVGSVLFDICGMVLVELMNLHF